MLLNGLCEAEEGAGELPPAAASIMGAWTFSYMQNIVTKMRRREAAAKNTPSTRVKPHATLIPSHTTYILCSASKPPGTFSMLAIALSLFRIISCMRFGLRAICMP